MSSQESGIMQPKEDNTQKIKITTQNKVKDPKKVEAGKSLAEMSRKAKEAKKKLQEKSQTTSNTSFTIFPFVGIISIFGLICYINYQPKKLEKPVSSVFEKPEFKPEVILDTFD